MSSEQTTRIGPWRFARNFSAPGVQNRLGGARAKRSAASRYAVDALACAKQLVVPLIGCLLVCYGRSLSWRKVVLP